MMGLNLYDMEMEMKEEKEEGSSNNHPFAGFDDESKTSSNGYAPKTTYALCNLTSHRSYGYTHKPCSKQNPNCSCSNTNPTHFDTLAKLKIRTCTFHSCKTPLKDNNFALRFRTKWLHYKVVTIGCEVVSVSVAYFFYLHDLNEREITD
jgi:hypothetical protein